MKRYRFLVNFACGLLLLSLGACDEPSTVGAGLIGEGGGTPEATDIHLFVEQDTLAPVTGNAGRVLAGTVDDPLLGTITATGYVDFSAAGDSAFRANTLETAFLDLAPDYAYGDTTGTVRLRLRDMATEWDASGATADTSLLAGQAITEFTYDADDTLVTVRLPDAWLREHAQALQAGNIEELFHGFALESIEGEAVSGFSEDGSRLRVVAEGDTALFSVDKHLTTIRRSGPATLPPNRLVLQDGTGLFAHFTVDSTALPSGTASLNHAELHLNVDKEVTEGTADFYRPPPERLRLYGIPYDKDENPVFLFPLQRTDDGEYVLSFQNRGFLRQLFQEWVLQGPPFERLRLVPAPVQIVNTAGGQIQIPINSLNTVFFYGAEAAPTCDAGDDQTCVPHLQLVYTPVE